jgi:hypothetical protein
MSSVAGVARDGQHDRHGASARRPPELHRTLLVIGSGVHEKVRVGLRHQLGLVQEYAKAVVTTLEVEPGGKSAGLPRRLRAESRERCWWCYVFHAASAVATFDEVRGAGSYVGFE